MDLTFTERELAFRDELRAWLADNQPGAEPTTAATTPATPGARDWQRRLLRGRLGGAALADASTAAAARR